MLVKQRGKIMKKIGLCFLLIICVLGLTACGRPARPGKLAREARKTYGSAKVVSKVKTPIGYSVTMHDKLQDFDYTIYSYRRHIGPMKVKSESEVAQSCPTLCDPMDHSPPGSSVHGILQARRLEWVAIFTSRGFSQPRN